MATKPVQTMVINNGDDAYTIYSPFLDAEEYQAFAASRATSSEVNNAVDDGLDELHATITGEMTTLHTTITSETASAISTAVTNKLGSNNGIATLDSTGKVPSSQLPSYVDDVLEYNNLAGFPGTGETGKIYVAKDTNKTYRWGGSSYVVISETLALGETSSTAYRGDRGKVAYDHAAAKGSAFTSGFYKITTNAQGHVTAVTAVTKNDITALGIAGTDIIDDNSAGNGDASHVWSADKVYDQLALKASLASPNFSGTPKISGYDIATEEYADAIINDSAAATVGTKTWSAMKTDYEIRRQISENLAAFAGAGSGKFSIKKTFATTSDMYAYSGSDVSNGDFVMISGNNPNNGKVYLKTTDGYVYINNFADFSSIINADPISSADISALFLDL